MSTRIIAILLLLLASTCDLKKDKLRRIQEADPGDDGSVTSFQSLVSHDELVEYEELLDTKLAFQKSIDFLPDAFEPDQQSYWDAYNKLILFFALIAIIPLLFVFVYFIVRFVFKKCKGPAKIREISKCYRYNTWILMGFASAAVLGLMITITVFSQKSRGALMKSFDLAISTISDTQIGLNYLSVFTKKYENDLILAKLPEFSSYSKNLEEGLKSYVSSSKKNTEQAKDLEKTRSLVTILLLVYFIIIIGVSLLGYVMKLDWLVMILGLLTFISIPGVLVFDGYITKFFFYYGDLCSTVNKAMYKGEFPVPGQALGYYVNCLERDVKFNLYIINNQLYKFQNGEKELPKPDEADATRLQNDLNKLINCEAVYKVVPTLENEFCKKGINWMYLVIQLFIWLLVSMIFLGVAIGRIEILVWRKKKEIESMMESMEAVY